jgi:F420-non-reducing hydrogenase small subunit
MAAYKPKAAFYWCSSCGGCEEAIVDLNETLLDVAAAIDIVLWPVAFDFKIDHIASMADQEIAVSFINGAIRTDEQAHVAKLLRKKSELVVAFGSCAHLGGIPGLANLTSREGIFNSAYHESPTVDNDEQTEPVAMPVVAGREVTLPAFWEQVHTLDQLVDVDYYLPGCPPMPKGISDAIQAILTGELPEKGAVLAPEKALCDTCDRRRSKHLDTKITALYRPHEIEADPEICFLEQGIICCGPATRGGCGGACIKGNMPCTGCYGPPFNVSDQGAKMLAAIASLFNADTRDEAATMASQIVDAAGSFYRYSVPASLLARRIEKE